MNLVAIFYFFFVLLVLLVIAAKSVVIVKPEERAVIFRLAKFLGVQSPGLVMIVPFIDKVVKVRTDQITGSERMTEDQLLERIAEIYIKE